MADIMLPQTNIKTSKDRLAIALRENLKRRKKATRKIKDSKDVKPKDSTS